VTIFCCLIPVAIAFISKLFLGGSPAIFYAGYVGYLYVFLSSSYSNSSISFLEILLISEADLTSTSA
jgi:hypothetical protein